MAGKIQTAASAAAAKNETPKTLNGWLGMYKNQIAKALPSVTTPERFIRIAMTAANANPQLQVCEPMSFLGAALTAAQLGLEPNTPLKQAYLIPYNNRKKGIVECQFQIGYKGLMTLVHRSGMLKRVGAEIVYENDDFEFEYGLEPKLKHKPAKSNRGKPVWVYASYHLTNGGYNFKVMSIDDVVEFAKKKSKTFDNGPWQTDFEAMAEKTVLKRVLKYAPMSSEIATAIAFDERSLEFKIEDEDVNVIPTTYTEVDTEDNVIIDGETGEIVHE